MNANRTQTMLTKNKSSIPSDVCVFRKRDDDLMPEVVPVWRTKAHIAGGNYDNWSKLETRLQHFFKCTQFRETRNNAKKCFATRARDRDFTHHLKDVHLNDTLYCIYCYPRIDQFDDYKNLDEVRVYNHESLVKHMKQCHRFRKYQCNLCLYRAITVDHVNIHQSRYHTHNYGMKASNGRRECKILECQPIDNNPLRISEYVQQYGVNRVADSVNRYQCMFCQFPNEELVPIIDHCVDKHPDYPILFYSPKHVRKTTEITVCRDESSDECQVLEEEESPPSTSSAVKMQDNKVSSTSHRERLLNASKERLKLNDSLKRNKERIFNRFKYVGAIDRYNTSKTVLRKNNLHSIRMNAQKGGNTLQKLQQRIKDKKIISDTTRNIRRRKRIKLADEVRVVNRGKLIARYSGSSADEDEDARPAKPDYGVRSESDEEEYNCVKISDESSDDIRSVRNSSPEPLNEQYVCVFCENTTKLKSRFISHMESHFAEMCALNPDYKISKRVERWIKVFADKQHKLAVYDDCNTPGYENQCPYHCPICEKLAVIKRKKPKSFRNFYEVTNHFWKHMAWCPVSCFVCDPTVDLPNCDTIINKHLNVFHSDVITDHESSVINSLLGDKMRHSFSYRQRRAVENTFINVHYDSVIDDFIKEQLNGIVGRHELSLRISKKCRKELPSISLSRLPQIDYDDENKVKKYLEAVKTCERNVKTLKWENNCQTSSDEDNSGDSSSKQKRKARTAFDNSTLVSMNDEMVAFMNSLTPEKPIGCGRCKQAFFDREFCRLHNSQKHAGKAMMVVTNNYN